MASSCVTSRAFPRPLTMSIYTQKARDRPRHQSRAYLSLYTVIHTYVHMQIVTTIIMCCKCTLTSCEHPLVSFPWAPHPQERVPSKKLRSKASPRFPQAPKACLAAPMTRGIASNHPRPTPCTSAQHPTRSPTRQSHLATDLHSYLPPRSRLRPHSLMCDYLSRHVRFLIYVLYYWHYCWRRKGRCRGWRRPPSFVHSLLWCYHSRGIALFSRHDVSKQGAE